MEVNWAVVEEQIQNNKSYRIKWKAYLGMTLTRAVARLKTQGLNSDEIFAQICKAHPEFPAELTRRLRIGVAARMGEMGTADSERNRRQ
jgi:hypothetical protein